MTRDSMLKEVLLNGIFADQVWLLGLHALGERQIISYLITHAHPFMRNDPILPVITVQDQIRLQVREKSTYITRRIFSAGRCATKEII